MAADTAELASEARRLADACRDKRTLVSEVRDARARVKESEERLETLRSETRRMESEVEGLISEAEGAGDELVRRNLECSGVRREIEEIRADRDQYLREISELRDHISRHRAACSALGVEADARDAILGLCQERDRLRSLVKESSAKVARAQMQVEHWLDVASKCSVRLGGPPL